MSLAREGLRVNAHGLSSKFTQAKKGRTREMERERRSYIFEAHQQVSDVHTTAFLLAVPRNNLSGLGPRGHGDEAGTWTLFFVGFL